MAVPRVAMATGKYVYRFSGACVLILFMTSSQTLTTADRFTVILNGLCRAVAARIAGGALAPAMIVLIWTRLKRAERQVVDLLTRFRDGRLRVVTGSRRAGGGGGGVRSQMPATLPRGFAWLIPLVPQWAAGYASQLRVVLAEPEMVALIAAAPQARRALRPMCRMLGIEPEMLAPRGQMGSETGVAVEVDGVGRHGDPVPAEVSPRAWEPDESRLETPAALQDGLRSPPDG